MTRGAPRRPGWLAAAVVFGLVAGGLSLLWRAAGPALLRALGGDPALGARVHDAFLAAACSLLALWVLGGLVASRRLRPWQGALLAVPVWLAVETFAAPKLAVPLGLLDYYAVRDPDHRPLNTDPRGGWNADSIRSARPAESFRPEGFNVIFLGDSFTFGVRLHPDQTIPAKVERQLSRAFPGQEIRVANFAWISASPLLSYRRLVDLGEKYHPDLVVLDVDMTDFRDDILWEHMLERRGIYAVYDRIPILLKTIQVAAPWLHRRLYAWSGADVPERRFFAAEQSLERSRPYLRTLERNVEHIRDWCRAHGADFAVFVLPRTFQYSDRESPHNWEADQYEVLGPYSLEPFRFFEEVAARADYPVYPLLDAFAKSGVFPTAFDDDPHWNDAGTSVAATAIAEALRPLVAARLGGGGPSSSATTTNAESS